jgi:hypothetical protein
LPVSGSTESIFGYFFISLFQSRQRPIALIPLCGIFTESNLIKSWSQTPSPLAGEGWGEGESG